jgi:hypothetical protein
MWPATLSIAAVMALAGSAGHLHSMGARAESAGPVQRVAEPPEGVYAICVGAYAHDESLVIRDGEFVHSIQTHGIYGGRTRGTYAVAGDTLHMSVTRTDPAPDGVRQPLTLTYDFVIGEYAGFPVLWRGTEPGTRSVAETGAMSQYAALFYGGPDPARPDVPSCAEVRERLGLTRQTAIP